MSVIAVAMVRNEVDIVAPWLRHVLSQCDGLLVADHGSTDGTRECLSDVPRTTVVDVDDPGYPQQRVINELALLSAHAGAEWIVPMDADEVWMSPGGRLCEVLPELEAMVCRATVYEHVLSQPEAGPDPFRRLSQRRVEPWPWSKVAFRPSAGFSLGMGAHEVSGIDGLVDAKSLAVHHFPVRSHAHLARKLARWEELRVAGALPDGAIVQYTAEVDWEPCEGIVYDPAPLCG